MKEQLPLLRAFYEGYSTRSYAFRKHQLQRLKAAILEHEKSLYEALYADLRKSPEESWVTEIGFLIAEINHALRHLKRWMKPKKVPTNLVNLPGKSFIYKEPLGVVLIIGPWNYPFQLLFAPLVGAIAAGNCAVLKPSEFAPATAAVMKKIISENFPGEYLLYAEGEGAVVIPQLMEDFRFDHIFYTGSTGVGRTIYERAARQLVPVTLELGGKSPCIVESDARLTVAARRIALATFSNAGQMCVAPDYVLVHESVREKFLEELKRVTRRFFSENPAASSSYGRIVNDKQFRRITGYLKQGHIIFGGGYEEKDLFIEPTIITDVPADATVMGEEIFGPVLPVIGFSTFEEAKAIIARNPNPLALYVFTESAEKERQWIEKIPFGGGCVNNASWHLTNFNLPFGGRGNSGIGAYHGQYSFEVFSHRKAVLKSPTWLDPSIRYPPFAGRLGLFKKMIP